MIDMHLLRPLAASAAVAVLIPILTAGPAPAAPTEESSGWQPTLLAEEPIYGGSGVRLRYTDGITVVASAGAEVIFKGSDMPVATSADGRQTYHRAVRVAESPKASLSDVADYSAAGRSVYTDALAAGFSPAEARRQQEVTEGVHPQNEPPILRSGCVRAEEVEADPDFNWSGCWIIYAVIESDPTAWYFAGSGTAFGWGTSVLFGKELERGYSQFSWNRGGRPGPEPEIIEASPTANVTGTDCNEFTIGLEMIIVLSYSSMLCSDGWDVTRTQTHHKVEWHGSSTGGESDTREASGASTARVAIHDSEIAVDADYEIGWSYICFFGC